MRELLAEVQLALYDMANNAGDVPEWNEGGSLYNLSKRIKEALAAPLEGLRRAAGSAFEALLNVPCVGEVYDQQHSDTHMQAWLDLKAALEGDEA